MKDLQQTEDKAFCQTVVRRSTVKDKILANLPNNKFQGSEMAEIIGIDVVANNGFYKTCPKVSKLLLELCKEGILYQWVIGSGGGLDGMTYNSHKWELYYLKRDSELAKQLLHSRGHLLTNYRFR